MKTFNDLLPGDSIYVCGVNQHEYSEKKVSKVYSDYVYYGTYSDKVNRGDVSIRKEKNSHGSREIFFANEVQAMRYCKAQKVKLIRSLIKSAWDKVEQIKKFREDNYEQLNIDWVESNLIKLEKQIR